MFINGLGSLSFINLTGLTAIMSLHLFALTIKVPSDIPRFVRKYNLLMLFAHDFLCNSKTSASDVGAVQLAGARHCTLPSYFNDVSCCEAFTTSFVVDMSNHFEESNMRRLVKW